MVQSTEHSADMVEAACARRHHVEKMDAIARLATGLTEELTPLVSDASDSVRELLTLVDSETHAAAHARLDGLRELLQRSAVVLRQLESITRTGHRPLSAVDVHAVITRLRPLFPRLAGPFITVQESLLAPSPWLLIEVGQLEQAILTLVVNARDAMPLGGQLTLTTMREDLRAPRPHRHGELPAGRWLTLSVSDTGTGMDEATLARVFEPFFTTKPPGLGSGLGLAMLYGMVRQHGGQVIVDTIEEKGTRVSVSFPEQPSQALLPIEEGATQAVLIVDDDEWIRNVTARVLRRAGYGVLEAAHGEAALELLRDVAGHCVGTVLTDIEMPRCDGRQLAEVVRREHPGLRVVLMTGGPTVDGIESDVLRKPFTAEELLAAVHRASMA